MHKQHGLSIIEMMVALLISSFLILGITQVYLDNRENTLFQQSQGQNIESARFSILLLEQTLAKTGYRRRPDETMEAAFPSINDPACGPMNAGSVVKRINATTFCIRYQPAFPGARTCSGDLIADIPNTPYEGAAPVVEMFQLTDGELRCNGQAIATGITALNFDYGINYNDDKRITEYTPEPAENARVRALQFAIMAASPTEIGKSAGSTVYEFWFGSAPNDKRLYTMLSSSASMRNLMP
ncbi:PilW family protein [Ectopseudomonas alcaliphila]|uniref:PilW family protein n=1 Tax=Ectopseudomonas alcaliphila TaxID=101564 RepID=UPI00277D8356|nr:MULTISPECIES: prepilin-type N-terminal cleavage/methylation domain-containing protein [Pseudomonas]MDP9938050.1 type IV pilus assembly protein PilW [Pseudomonas sp. 3400]MDR7010273.1 type IV pilus assembly protein PilW [Pseudomonas alcaliphila]